MFRFRNMQLVLNTLATSLLTIFICRRVVEHLLFGQHSRDVGVLCAIYIELKNRMRRSGQQLNMGPSNYHKDG